MLPLLICLFVPHQADHGHTCPPPALVAAALLLSILDKFSNRRLDVIMEDFLLLHISECLIANGRLGGLEFPSRDLSREELVDLLEGAALQLWDEEEEENQACQVRARPDVSVLRTLFTSVSIPNPC